MAFKNYRQETKSAWGSYQEGSLNLEQIQTGCLLRIADATEKMASNYAQLQRDLDTYKRWYREECDKVQKLNRRVSALQGVITKLKKKK